MRSTGFSKKIDTLGRIVVPKDVRAALGIELGDSLSFYVDGDAIVMKRTEKSCCVCGSAEELTEIRDKHICAECKALL